MTTEPSPRHMLFAPASLLAEIPVPTPAGADAESPSLRAWSPGSPRAYEMKFLLTEAGAATVESLIRPALQLDPHGSPEFQGGYRTTTLYCDTPELDVYRQMGPHGRRKYRIRRYGDESAVYLERKSKRGERVRKRRSVVNAESLSAFDLVPNDQEWSGRWFHEQARRKGLAPALRVHYLRRAWFGALPDGAVRVTFDRDVRGIATNTWCAEPFDGGAPVLDGHVICEFKFSGFLPAYLRSIIQSLDLTPRGVSKYRLCMAAAGLAPAGGGPHA